ncbi:ACT domain-containing protein [Syntrophomonas palmitatica]|uniref:ACT domain-containing protein n=1 Tax=Syntrophomonas palmitatica TaxID=402877 RepID=UPI0006D146C5|nr:ACT domain-containing protein [Syntrophomonas palmitatica]
MEDGKRVIITVLGYDKIGIIANISAILANTRSNILDISQTILQGFFTMVMVVDMTDSTVDVAELRRLLTEKGQEMEMEITVQHEDIFKFMHRV